MSKIIVLGSFDDSLVKFRGSLLKRMVELGHTVIGCAPPTNSDQVERSLNAMGVKYMPIELDRAGMNPWRDIKTFIGLFTLFRVKRPDVVLSYTIKPVLYGSIAAKLAGAPHIFSIVSGLGYVFSGNGCNGLLWIKIVRVLYKISLRANKNVFFQNPDDQALFKNYGLLRTSEQAVQINGSGVDVDYFKPMPLPRNVSFLLIARLLHSKGVREYLEAAEAIKSRHPTAVFRLVGWIDKVPDAIAEDELNRLLERGMTEYLGKIEDVRPVIAESSVYVLPSYREGTPRTVLEAMAMGRPVVTTDVPGCRETVRDGYNGFLVPARDYASLTLAMERFIKEPSLIASMGKRSREIAVEKYDVRKVNAIILRAMGLTNEASL